MIRVFKPTDRDFTSNGDAVIVPIKARVKNNMNGEFFIELTCESKFYKYLDQGNIIITPTPQGEQAFRIDNQLSRKGERITIKARHVFYDAEKLVVADSYAVDLTCEQALKHFNAATDSTSPFTMHSDITSLNSFRCVRKSLAEAIGTVIERWGGYLVRNNWDISVNKSVGRDYGVTIRYAKNLKELTASYDFSGVATKLLPVGKDGILLPELYVSSAKQYSIPYTKVVSIQQDINEDDYSTEEEYQAAVIADLRTQAQALVNKTCIPVITYTLKGNPEKVQDIGDVIEVIDERIGVNITTQVIGYEWDVITEQYASLTFGNFGNTLSGLMAKVNADTKGVVNEAVGEVKSSINNIYDLLQGSYVLYRGYDILLLDRIPAGTAQNVIKFSKDGISVSSDGINGDFNEVYNIATKNLSVPSISLNGKNLQATLDDKISYDNLKEGNNITITRKGKIITINSTGGDGGIRLYYGADIPANSFGSNKDIYIQLDTAMANLLAFDASYSGTSITNYSATETNRKWDITATFLDNWEYHSFDIYSLQNLTVGKKYIISFDFQNDGVPPLYGIGKLFGLTLQHTNRFIDMRNWSSDLVENGEFKYFADSYYGEWWYQSFPNDTKRVHYEFEFTARQTTEYIGFYGDRTSGQLTCSLYELCVGDKVQTNEIKDIYYKLNNQWSIYDRNVTLYHGLETPSYNLGNDADIYIQLAPDSNSLQILHDTGGMNGELNYTFTNNNRVYEYKAEYNHSQWYDGRTFLFFPDILEEGKTYLVHFDAQSVDGSWSGSGDRNQSRFYGLAYQKQNNIQIHDGTQYEHVANGGYEYLSQFGDGIYYQSFFYDHEKHTYEFEFVATQQGYLCFYADDFVPYEHHHIEITNFYVVDVEAEGTEINKTYYKLNDEWVENESGKTYEAGDNILIEDNVISGNYQPFEGTDGTEDGASGLVPQPLATDVNKFLKSDGTWAEVQGGGGSNLIVDAQIYSLEEKQIGVWVDGRPLYQKTFITNVTLASGVWAVTGDSVLNGKAIDAEVTTIGQGSDTIPVWCEIGADGHIELLNIRGGGQVTITHYTVRYFKTTDTAGSGGFQAYGFTPIIYSTEERQVGVWTDNKPLYQKTFDCGALLNAQTKEVSFTEDMETATIIDAFAMSTNEGYIISIPDVVPNYVAGSVGIYISKTNKKICIYSQADMRTYDKSYVTIQYTKTTDTAGSGSYTTLGIPAHHYDGNEKIIGTWFSATLYEKTINATVAPPYSSIDLSNLNIDEVVGCEGYAKSSSGDTIPVGYSVASGNQYLVVSFEKATSILYITISNSLSVYNNVFLTIRYTKNT